MVDEEDMQELYQWIDDIPLSRPKRNINRDFSDGVLTAELVNHHFPKLVDLHNYSAANSVSQKQYNWKTLNQKVFKKMNFSVTAEQINSVCECAPGSIEKVLNTVRDRINQILDGGSKLPATARIVRRATVSEVPSSAPVFKQNNKPPVNKPKPVNRAPASQPVPRYRQSTRNENPNQPAQQPARKQPAVRPTQQPTADRPPPSVQEPARPTYNIPLMQPGSPRRASQPTAVQQPAAQPQRLNMMTELDRSQRLSDLQGDKSQWLSELSEVDVDILVEKESTIQELRETVRILETKVLKMEQLLKLKDQKITKLMSAVEAR